MGADGLWIRKNDIWEQVLEESPGPFTASDVDSDGLQELTGDLGGANGVASWGEARPLEILREGRAVSVASGNIDGR